MDFKDYYKILGVDPAAEGKAIKTAYRKLARKYHPDVSDEESAEDEFKEVNEAYEVLKDKEKRTDYDQLRQYGQGGESFEPPPGWQSGREYSQQGDDFAQGGYSDFFENLFRSAGAGPERHSRYQQQFVHRGEDIDSGLSLFLEEAISGEPKTISYHVPRMDESGHFHNEKKTLKINIPAGVTDGERIRLKGQGGPGMGDAPNGDLYITIQLAPHPLYDIDGRDLSITVPVAPWEAALGAKVTVPTPGGSINLTLPANSQTGKRLRVKGKGLNSAKASGDLYAVIKVVMPDNSDEKMQKLWQQIADDSAFEARAGWGK
ncbi:MAG: DnaJ domain-containing protein [Halieaceae bacterium]|nr:DnaJ domain-containing protein [Halieaceae bacterium]